MGTVKQIIINKKQIRHFDLSNFLPDKIEFKLAAEAVLRLNNSSAFSFKHLHFIIGLRARVDFDCLFKQLVGKRQYYVTADLMGAYSQLNVNLLHNGQDQSEADYFLTINHQAANSFSKITIRRLLQGRARSNLYGLVKVWPQAKAVDSFLLDKTLLMGRRAQVVSKPDLKILNNQAAVYHGVTVSRPDHKEIDYLTSRGFTNRQALNLVVQGFIKGKN
ncbi:SufD family Fe-S cluster assembly protein [Patescibacteria group bacterium]|nr:SufD family Fe-S cluster assembly protein [Patescibacteria group bacterium]